LTATTVIIAAQNEEEGIGLTLTDISKNCDDLACIVVDGNSNDSTIDIAKKYGADVYLQKGVGKGDAISQAIERVCDNTKYVVFIDADFTYPAKFIKNMIQILEEKPRVGMVLGNRFNHFLTPAAMKNPFYIGNRFIALTQNLLNGVNLTDPLTGLRVVRWKILKGWKPRAKGFDIEVEMNNRVERKGYDIEEIPIYYRVRVGEKKLKLRHGFMIFRRIVVGNIRSRIDI
jgi:glycosyltransferase involved in cell wall biosynthesis